MPTVGGILLFGRERDRYVPDAWIRRRRGGEAVAPRRTILRLARTSWCAVLLCLACEDPGTGGPLLDIPQRPSDAPGGAEVARAIRTLDLEAREVRIYAEVARGNVPAWLRQLEPVEMVSEVDGHTRTVTFWVMPDYLAVGSDTDFFRVPLTPGMALRIADLVGGSLPTSRMVDAVWAAARTRLIPIRMGPDEDIWTVRYFERHNRLVQAQARQHGARLGDFLAGHRLDVVLATPPLVQPGEVALYGWHHRNGEPIQPLLPIPLDGRPHFSMGVRLVQRDILVDGADENLLDSLRDPDLAPLIGRPGGPGAHGVSGVAVAHGSGSEAGNRTGDH